MGQKGILAIPLIIGLVILGIGFVGLKSYESQSLPKQADLQTAAPSPNVSFPAQLAKPSSEPTRVQGIKPTPTPKISPTALKSPTATPQPTPVRTSSPIPTVIPLPKVTCSINVSSSSGWSPVWVSFSYSSSDQSRVTAQEWDLDGNNTWESEVSSTSWTYKDVGSYEAKLRLKLSDGTYSDTCNKTITVNAPQVTCEINASVTSGSAPLDVNFVYGATFNGVSDDYVTDVQWDFNGDGSWDTPYDYSSQHPPVYTFSSPGNYTAKMHLKTNKGTETSICTKSITVN